MKAILQHKSRRKSFIYLVSSILLIIFLIRTYVIPFHFDTTMDNELINYSTLILDKISISLITSFFLAWFLFRIELPEESSNFEYIEPQRIKESLENGRYNTSFWYFSGGAGGYSRTSTIPKLHFQSKTKNQSKSIKILLIDPRNNHNCLNYLNYRGPRRSAANAKFKWDSDFLNNQIISTICSAILHRSINPMLEIDIYLKNNFSTMRIDINENNCLVTTEDKLDPALLSKKDSIMYKKYLEELLNESRQSEKLDSNFILKNVTSEKITKNQIKEICDYFNFKVTDDNIEIIKETINVNKEIY